MKDSNYKELSDCPTCHRPYSSPEETKHLNISFNGICLGIVSLALLFIAITRPAILMRLTGRNANASSLNNGGRAGQNLVAHNTSDLTAEDFKKLKVGMTLPQIKRILGTEGTRTSFSKIAGVPTALYHWQNPDGSNISVETRNAHLALKASFGLSGVGEAKQSQK